MINGKDKGSEETGKGGQMMDVGIKGKVRERSKMVQERAWVGIGSTRKVYGQ